MKSRYVRVVALPLAALLGFALALWSAGAHPQTSGKIPRIGYIWIGAEGSDRVTRPGLQKGLIELGYKEGRDIVIEYRYADGSVERLRELVTDTRRNRRRCGEACQNDHSSSRIGRRPARVRLGR